MQEKQILFWHLSHQKNVGVYPIFHGVIDSSDCLTISTSLSLPSQTEHFLSSFMRPPSYISSAIPASRILVRILQNNSAGKDVFGSSGLPKSWVISSPDVAIKATIQ